MQIEACALCAEPALDRYRVVRDDLIHMTQDEAVIPLCEPHRIWLEAGAERGRLVREGVRWRLG